MYHYEKVMYTSHTDIALAAAAVDTDEIMSYIHITSGSEVY